MTCRAIRAMLRMLRLTRNQLGKVQEQVTIQGPVLSGLRFLRASRLLGRSVE